MIRSEIFHGLLADMPENNWIIPSSILSALLFIFGMGLIGNSDLSGYFYVGSLIVGTPVIFRLGLLQVRPAGPVRHYMILLACFSAVVVANVFFRGAGTGHLEQAGRLWIGLVNGLFFLLLFGCRREVLIAFLALVAASHLVASVVTSLSQVADFSRLMVVGRAHGTTNALPFSEMLLASIGLVSIYAAGAIDARAPWRGLFGLTAILLIGLAAVALTGSRGTLLAYLLLLPLIALVLIRHLSLQVVAAFVAACTVVMLVAGAYVFAREPEMWAVAVDLLGGGLSYGTPSDSTSIRLEMWQLSLQLVTQAPIFGHGLDSFPDLMRDPEFGLPADSILFIYNHVHNQYIDLLLEVGVFGLLLYLGPIVVAVLAGLRALAHSEDGVWGASILWVAGAYSIFGLTQTYYAHASTALQFGVYMGMLIWAAPGSNQPPGRRPAPADA